MRFSLFTALLIALVPSISVAQDWKSWTQENPTYPAEQAAPLLTQPSVAAPPSSPRPLPRAVPGAVATPQLTGTLTDLNSTQSPLFEDRFMQGCTQHSSRPGAAQLCACALTGIQNTYTFEQFKQVAIHIQTTNRFPESLQQIMFSCLASRL